MHVHCVEDVKNLQNLFNVKFTPIRGEKKKKRGKVEGEEELL
jgi:hypothetical protein